EGARIPVVGEDHPGRDHDPILDGDPGRDVDHRVDLHEVPDLHAVGDVGLLADDAVVTDGGRSPEVHAVPDRRASADADPGFDERGRMDARRAAGARAGHACALRRCGVSRSLSSIVSTGTQRPERSERYAASTAATARRHSAGVIHGGRAPRTTSTNAFIIVTCEVWRSYRPACRTRGSCPATRSRDCRQPMSRVPLVPCTMT